MRHEEGCQGGRHHGPTGSREQRAAAGNVDQGREAAKSFLSENPEIMEKISDAIIKVVKPELEEKKELEEAAAS